MKTNTIKALAILVAFTIFVSSCAKEPDEKKSVGKEAIDDQNFYKVIGYTIMKCYIDIFNQNIPGTVVGEKNIITQGPLGGDLKITGTTMYSSSNDITTVDLLYSMTSVRYVFSQSSTNNRTWMIEVILTGEVTEKGSFSQKYTNINYQATALNIKAAVTNEDNIRNINKTGKVNINRSGTSTGDIFGYLVQL